MAWGDSDQIAAPPPSVDAAPTVGVNPYDVLDTSGAPAPVAPSSAPSGLTVHAGGGYMPQTEFTSMMNDVFGEDGWNLGGGYRSPQREDQLRAEGAKTVAPGHTSEHSLGTAAAPGAYDVTVPGMPPDQVAKVLQARGYQFKTLYPEGAAGPEGAHLHIGMQPGVYYQSAWGAQDTVAQPPGGPAAANPGWGASDPVAASTATPAPSWGAGDPVAKPGIQGWLQGSAAGRLVLDYAGGATKGVASLIHGFAEMSDVQTKQYTEQIAQYGGYANPETGRFTPVSPEIQAQARAELKSNPGAPVVTQATDPTVKAIQTYGANLAPWKKSMIGQIVEGGGEMTPSMAAAVASLPAGVEVFYAQGFAEAHDAAIAKGASPDVANRAGMQTGIIQAGIGNLPIGHMLAPLLGPLVKTAPKILQFGAKTVLHAGAAGAQGAATQVGSNVVAQQNYDPNQGLLQDVPQSAAQWALAGGVLHVAGEGYGAVAGRLRPRPAAVDETGEKPAAPMPATDAVEKYIQSGPTSESVAPAAPAPTWGGSDVVAQPAPAGEVSVTLPAISPEAATIAARVDPAALQVAAADVDEYRSATPKGYTIFQAMKDLGGLRVKEPDGSATPGPDVQGALQDVSSKPPGMINNKSGLSPERMFDALTEEGWFGPNHGDEDFVDAIRRQGTGEKAFHPDSETPALQARRVVLDHEMAEAGVAPADDPMLAAAKLGAWREDQMRLIQNAPSPEMLALQSRAAELGVTHAPDAPHDELLADVLEREAIQGEHSHDDIAEYERSIHAQLTPADLERLDALAAEGAEGQHDAGAPAYPLPEGWESEPGTPEGYSEPFEGPERGGEDVPQAAAEVAALGHAPDLDDLEFAAQARGHEYGAAHLEWANAAADPRSDPAEVARLRDSAQAAHWPALEAKRAYDQAKARSIDSSAAQIKFAREGVFYSAAQRAIDANSTKAALPDQWKATLDNAQGVKKEELDWTGVKDWLDLFPKGEKVPKEAVSAFLRDHGVQVKEVVLGHRATGPEPDIDRSNPFAEVPLLGERYEAGSVPQFADWKTPGGSDYHELLLTLPQVANPPATHWDTPGVMAHVRFDTRTDTEGKKVLFVQEVQSDWHQKGRDQGYAVAASAQETEAAHKAFAAAKLTYRDVQSRLISAVADKVPARLDALREILASADPAAKPRLEAMIRQSENNLQMLSSPVRSLEDRGSAALALAESRMFWAIPGPDPLPFEDIVREDSAALLAINEANQRVQIASGDRGIPNAPFKSSWPALVMKRVIAWAADHGFEKVAWTTGEQQGERYSLENDEGIRAFYDRNLVNITNDLIKKYGAKVGKVGLEHPDIATLRENARVSSEALASARDRIERVQGRRDSPDEEGDRRYMARAVERAATDLQLLEDARAGQPQSGFDITDKMRGAATNGFPLFARPGEPGAGTPDGLHIRAPANTDARAEALIQKVAAEVARLAPHAEVRPADEIAYGSERVRGASFREGAKHVIAWALDSADPIGVGRHEAVHALRTAGMFSGGEWKALAHEAVSDGWIKRYGIDRRYGDQSEEIQIEEAIADRFAEWRRDGLAGFPSFVRDAFNRLRLFLDRIAAATRQAFGQKMTGQDVFTAIERGEIGKRSPDGEAGTPMDAIRFARQADDRERKGPRGVMNAILGRGAESVGRKLVLHANRAIPDPVAELLDSVKSGVNPMGTGSERAQASAKDFANTLRQSAHQWGKLDEWLTDTFTPAERRLMWEAADEHGVILRRGEVPGEGQGMNRLPMKQAEAVRAVQARANKAFANAQRLGMVNSEGLESYVPRMVVEMTLAGPNVVSKASPKQAKRGANLSTTTGQLRQRKYETVEETEAAAKTAFGEGATVVRDIRTLALATQRLEQAVAGRTLVDKIKAISKDAETPLVKEGGANPDASAYFTIDGHPALQTWQPKFTKNADTGKYEPVVDQNGEVQFEAQPLWISKEFEGPLKAVLAVPTGGVARALLNLKAKMMSVVMYSPLMHNAVIWGKAIPADPVGVVTLGAYRRGNLARKDPATMQEAIGAGMDPIGHRYFNQDITGIAAAEGQDIVPGRSWTAQVLSFVPGLFDKEAGESVKRAVDKFGDVWHNTFLWDRIADLQAGLYIHIRDGLLAKGVDPLAAQRTAAHFANRYAGAMPMETLSKAARTTANLLLFSRSFTLGNLAAYKDIVMGLPSDVRAQIMRDGGLEKLEQVQGVARGKAAGMLIMDVALSRIGLVLAAAATAWLTHQTFQPPWQNEQGKDNRFLIGFQPDGTAVYGRLPTGKVGEELVDWVADPRDILLRKLSPYGRLMYEMASNDKGFGQKLYDPYERTPVGYAKNVGRVAWEFAGGLAPESQLEAARDIVTGAQNRKTAELEAFAPLAGLTISKGAPGGPAMADIYAQKDEAGFEWQENRKAVVAQIKAGDLAGARATMTALGVPPGLQNYQIRVAQNPRLRMSGREIRDFLAGATPAQRAQFEADRAAGAQREVGN